MLEVLMHPQALYCVPHHTIGGVFQKTHSDTQQHHRRPGDSAGQHPHRQRAAERADDHDALRRTAARNQPNTPRHSEAPPHIHMQRRPTHIT